MNYRTGGTWTMRRKYIAYSLEEYLEYRWEGEGGTPP